VIDEGLQIMMFTPGAKRSGQALRRGFVAAASLAVIASFAGAPAAQAASRGALPDPHHALRAPRPAEKPQAPHVKRTHPAPPAANRNITPTGRFAPLAEKPHFAHPAIHRPARPARPAAVVRPQVKLWHGVASYTLRPNVRLKPGVISSITGSCQITAGNHSGTWSPAACPNGYEVQGDVTVPVGKTLTIKPNTVVYFDTTVDGSLTPLHPSELTDLIVDGTLTVAGTTAEPVLLTSANAAPSSAVTPEAGDWGYVFFNHTGGNKGTGSITHMRLQYGEGIAADRVAPPISDSTISNVAAGLTAPLIADSIERGAGIDYSDIPGGTVTMSHDVFDGAQVAGMSFMSAYNHVDFSGAASAGHPFSLHLIDNHITGGGSTGLEDAVRAESLVDSASSADDHSEVALDVQGNHVTQTSDGYEFNVEAENESSTVAGTSAIAGEFSSNTLTGGDESSGTYFYSYDGDGTATGTKTCTGAAACVLVPFMSDHVSARFDAVENEAYVNVGAGRAVVATAVGKVVKKKIKKTVKKHGKKHHKIVTKLVDTGGGVYQSEDDDAWESLVYAEGTGSASSSVPAVASTFDSDDRSVDADVVAYHGSAGNTVTARHSSMTSSDDENIEVETEGSDSGTPPAGSTGSAFTTIGITGGHYTAEDENIDSDETSSDYGSSSSHITVSDATLSSSDDDNVDAESFGSEDGGSGSATSDVAISSSTLSADDGGVENEAEAYHGTAPATADVTATHSTIDARDDSGIENEAFAAEDSGSHGNASLTTTVNASKIQSEDESLDLESESYWGGSATSNPKVISSTLASADDDAIDNEVEATIDGGSGAASGSPSITGSTVEAEDDVIDNSVESNYGTGTTTGSPTITNSTTSSAFDYDIYNDVTGKDETGASGGSVGSPVISGGTATAAEYDIYNEVTGYYGGASGSPALKSVTATAGDDYAIYNDVTGSEDASSGSATANPEISKSTVHAEEYGIYNEAFSYRGAGTANPLISHSTVVASDDDLIYNEVYADESGGTGHTATGSPRVVDSTTHSDDAAIYNEVYAYEGPAVGRPAITGSNVTVVDDYGFENYVYSSESGGTGSATAEPVISKSSITTYEYALYNEAIGYRGAAAAKPSISHSHLNALFDGAIYNYSEGGEDAGTGSANASPTVSSSPIYCGDCSSDYGIYDEAYSPAGAATSSPVITSSGIHNGAGYGLYNEAYSAQTSGHGAATANPVITSSPITSYDYGVFNEADADDGNSPANGSFTFTGSHITTLDDTAIESEAYGAGSGGSTVSPAVSSAVLRSPDDDVIDVTADPGGTGAALVGGHITSSTLAGSDDVFDVTAQPSSVGGSSTFDTSLKNDDLTSTDDDDIYADYHANGASLTMAPKITGGSMTAADDYAVYLDGSGYGGVATDEVKVDPTITDTPIVSADGIYLDTSDDSGSTEPGHVVVEGAISGSSITAVDSEGIYANSSCSYCTGGARTAVTVSNSPVKSEEGIDFSANAASTTTAPASLGGSVTSTHGDHVTASDDDGIYGFVESALGNVADSLKVSGLHISGEDGAFYNEAYAEDGNASDTASFTNNTVDNENASTGEDGVYDEVLGEGAGHTATLTATITHNSVSDLPGDAEGIFVYGVAGGQLLPKVTVEHNTVTNIGEIGVDVEGYWGTAPPSADGVTLSHNTISRTGEEGVYLYGLRPTVTSNTVTSTGLSNSLGIDGDGIYEDGSPYQGSLTCNVITGNALGIQYGADNPTTGSAGHNGDPKTNDNSFRAISSSLRNSKDLKTGNTGKTDAQDNFWGGSPRLVSPSSSYDTTPKLSSVPKCAKTAGN
jgi:parallel beta-helix repeat protein